MYSFFSQLHFKIAKSAIITQKKFFLEKYQDGYQKNAEFYSDFKFVGADLNKCPSKKARAKKLSEFLVFSFLCIFLWFFAFNFC
jgi:hypothetical protein